ncbi:phenylacetaldehyde dehydrogenase [Azospirillum lipoferum]|uniref:Aldehyde dehydrogenase family protein n=1 Tax=Azospirillum lipoferum TaxID=193 RepID=A0A5A9G285_AZOLI|nr:MULTISPECIES: aldehyde dehydrogenase family protein [Azospirillum]KAA0588446.1 aldehyde dehydrogenase family protein [Azospirillum lipoferum]MCP1615235.1 phenylacetaldehyde dehydrogenase [Azospirillum lipoferum]MDW5534071.1 aldehyde dehydrogenase family protein [Azospirillum sp. NL1]
MRPVELQGWTQPAYSPAVNRLLGRRPAHFIDNEWVESTGNAQIEVIDPSTSKIIGHIADATAEDIDRAVRAARAAFDDGRWSGLPPIRREAAINRLADLIEANADEFAELEAIDNGKPRAMAAAVDVPGTVAQLRYMAGWATKISGEVVDPLSAPTGAFHGYVRREPIGVAGQIIPWNFPLLMAALKIAPALAAGCTLVLKPAEQTSLTALRLADMVLEAGFPAGVVNVVTGDGRIAGDALVRHPLVDKIAFTGSTEVGKIINRTATDTLKRVTLELGGKSPVIVMPDVELESAAAGAAGAIFFNAGQVCVAGSRLFAHRDIYDRFLDGVVDASKAWTPRPSLDPTARMGPVVSREQHERVLRYIDEGRRAGATVMTGGDAPAAEGYYLNPTVLADVNPQMSVVREEIFGPVVVVQRFDDLDEVAAAANDTAFGLGASIWTRDLSVMHRLAAKVRAGTVWGNCHGVLDAALPFGGYKQSGVGREQARQGLEAYTELKSVIIQL